MNLRVSAIALTLTAAAILVGGVAAQADEDNEDDRPIPGSTEYPKPHHPHPEEDELHDRYGDDVGQVNLPPLVIRQRINSDSATIAEKTEKLVNAGNADPAGNVPVDPATIHSHRNSPAETFFNTATIGLGVMGAGAAALGAVAIRRTVKLRKDPKSDFLYQ